MKKQEKMHSTIFSSEAQFPRKSNFIKEQCLFRVEIYQVYLNTANSGLNRAKQQAGGYFTRGSKWKLLLIFVSRISRKLKFGGKNLIVYFVLIFFHKKSPRARLYIIFDRILHNQQIIVIYLCFNKRLTAQKLIF